MLDHAIYMDTGEDGIPLVETNHGIQLKASRWSQDCEFQLVLFEPSKDECQIIHPGELARYIKLALQAINQSGVLNGKKPNWYRELSLCAKGAA